MTSFAENQLKKYGWIKGQGLGKNAEGRKTPITVIKKNDTHGLGDNSEDWSFEWWNKVYTKTLDNIKVSKTSDGEVKVSKMIKESTVPRNHMGIISTSESLYSLSDSSTFANTSTHKSRFDDGENKSSHSNLKMKSLLYYGNFIKSSTPLDLNGCNKPIKKMEINNESKSVDNIDDSLDIATTSSSFDLSHYEEKREKSRKKKRKFEEDIILAKKEKCEKKKTKKRIKEKKKL